MKHPKKAAMLAALAKTGNVSASARAADIERCTHYRWLQSDPNYAAAVAQAKEEAIEVLEAVARQRAIVGPDTLLIFLLKAARPEVYRDRYDVRHSGGMKVEHEGDPFELLRDPQVAHALDAAFARKAMQRQLPAPAGSDAHGKRSP